MSALKRVSYFNGQLLGAEDMQAEQDYHLARQRRHNLRTLGHGVVSGLHVSSVGGAGVKISPGLAIDPYGNEIVIDEPQMICFPPGFDPVWLVVSFTEKLTDPVPAGGEGRMQPSRVEEGFKLEYTTGRDAPCVGAIRLGRLRMRDGGWEIAKACGGSLVTCGLVFLGLAAASFLIGRRTSTRP